MLVHGCSPIGVAETDEVRAEAVMGPYMHRELTAQHVLIAVAVHMSSI